jgi:hypothetical protein
MLKQIYRFFYNQIMAKIFLTPVAQIEPTAFIVRNKHNQP